MIVLDPYYGEIEIAPQFIPLISSELGNRARNITMGTVPNWLMPLGPLPNRFQHGLGVYHLAQIVAENNELESERANLLCAASLMHDWGNPPFAHLSEPILTKHYGHNGESFLSELMEVYPRVEIALQDIGLRPDVLVSMIQGKHGQFSRAIHGSMDIDNLDNLNRAYYCFGNTSTAPFDPLLLAIVLQYDEETGWHFLDGESDWKSDIKKWKEVRRGVYRTIHSPPHLIMANMLSAALYYAHQATQINREFFYKNDYEAWNYMLLCCPAAGTLINALQNWEWYVPLFWRTAHVPTKRMYELASNWENRILLAEKFAAQNGIAPQEVTVYVGRGNQERKIELPIKYTDRIDVDWDEDFRPEYHSVLICTHPRHGDSLSKKAVDFYYDEIW